MKISTREHDPSYAHLEILLFGPMEVLVNGQVVPEIRSRKAHWLLALLALRQGQEVDRAWLAGTLWPDMSQARAFVNLRQSLADLRRALGVETRSVISPQPRSLMLQPQGAKVDVSEFRAASQKIDPDSRETAIALYRGELLEGCSEEWVAPDREALSLAYQRALEDLARFANARGDRSSELLLLRKAISANPLNEGARRDLMRTLALCGDHSAAVQTYRELRELLMAELNTEPDIETSSVFRQIRELARDRSIAGSGKNGAPTPPLPGRIPIPLTELIGREVELKPIRDRFSAARIISLTGSGGIGKTRLAIQVAREVQEESSWEICFVELAAVNDPDLVPHAVAKELGIGDGAGEEIIHTLAGVLKERRVLLVLDNCEHLADACAALAHKLLKECRNLTILATSRQPLGVPGEVNWRVPSLSLPDITSSNRADQSPEQISSFEAIRLFVDRASAARTGFALTSRNADSICRICRRLDGIPLAIELAAARINLFSAEQLDRRLEESFALLARSGTGTSDRHNTMRAAMEWSYALLSDHERSLFCRLSVFAGAFTVEAAQAVAGQLSVDTENEVELLEALVNKSLVNVLEDDRGASYRLLGITREFAGDLLAKSGIEHEARRRHAVFYLDIAERTSLLLDTPDQAAQMDELEAAHDNLRAALDWLNRPESTEEDFESNLRLCGALARFWSIRGYLGKARGYLKRSLERESPPTLARAGLLVSAVLDDLFVACEPETARQYLQTALQIYRELGHDIGITESLYRLGRIARAQSNWPEARSLYQESLEVAERAQLHRSVSECLTGLGRIAVEEGDYPAAMSFYLRALEAARKSGVKLALARPLTNIAVAAFAQGDFDTARARHEECLEINREVGAKSGIGWSLNNLGDIALAQTDLAAAKSLYFESLNISTEVDNTPCIAECLRGLAQLLVHTGGEQNIVNSARLFGAAEAMRKSIGVEVSLPFMQEYDNAVEKARASLEDPRFTRSWEEGGRVPVQRALELAQSCFAGNPN